MSGCCWQPHVLPLPRPWLQLCGPKQLLAAVGRCCVAAQYQLAEPGGILHRGHSIRSRLCTWGKELGCRPLHCPALLSGLLGAMGSGLYVCASAQGRGYGGTDGGGVCVCHKPWCTAASALSCANPSPGTEWCWNCPWRILLVPPEPAAPCPLLSPVQHISGKRQPLHCGGSHQAEWSQAAAPAPSRWGGGGVSCSSVQLRAELGPGWVPQGQPNHSRVSTVSSPPP